ncbi:uncharacterized protein LOC133532889 [Cydia pomonella]|uniref:uncharacterized protein LOC133532889 n=1 Tax=Cydia pomonella TaxID=82600 RepID=UPI002ADE3502|nr:uncharacterized protein LOC133532889 [Cydia pomonella]
MNPPNPWDFLETNFPILWDINHPKTKERVLRRMAKTSFIETYNVKFGALYNNKNVNKFIKTIQKRYQRKRKQSSKVSATNTSGPISQSSKTQPDAITNQGSMFGNEESHYHSAVQQFPTNSPWSIDFNNVFNENPQSDDQV